LLFLFLVKQTAAIQSNRRQYSKANRYTRYFCIRTESRLYQARTKSK
jgi:hypothetical protein